MINNILVTGGTHGNELTGITVVQQWNKIKAHLNLTSPLLDISSIMINHAAIEKRTRYVEQDLNRQFSSDKLAQIAAADPNKLCEEETLALELNKRFGPKSSPIIDLVIDFHNTTANLGPCLIILTTDDFEIGLARYVKKVMPEAVILLENEKTYEQFPYLCTLGKHGVMIELGSQSHGVNDPTIFASGLKMLKAITSYCDLYNQGNLPELTPIESFHLTGDVKYPTEKHGALMIHPNLFGHDFNELKPGAPCFITIDGESIKWERDVTFPHFIGEVAYQHLGLAFSTADKIML
ncbi:MAG: aspartoacylase [Pseudomonadota bacterium]